MNVKAGIVLLCLGLVLVGVAAAPSAAACHNGLTSCPGEISEGVKEFVNDVWWDAQELICGTPPCP